MILPRFCLPQIESLVCPSGINLKISLGVKNLSRMLVAKCLIKTDSADAGGAFAAYCTLLIPGMSIGLTVAH